MLLALTDHLRCTSAHAESVLVARVDSAEARRMITGALGCPVCHEERRVIGGVVYWLTAPAAPPSPESDLDGDGALRLAAELALAESAAPYVLCGGAGLAAAGLGGIADAPLILLDPPDDRAAVLATVIRGAPRVPLAPRTARGVALGGVWADEPERVVSAVAALAPRGRLVAPAHVPLPAGVHELARDAREWVAERDPNIVRLARAAAR